jgi:hypothetical protein
MNRATAQNSAAKQIRPNAKQRVGGASKRDKKQNPVPAPKMAWHIWRIFLPASCNNILSNYKYWIIVALLPLLLGGILAIIANAHRYAASPTTKMAVLLYSILSFFALLQGAVNHLLMAHRGRSIGDDDARLATSRILMALAIVALVSAIQSALLVSIFSFAAKLPSGGIFLVPIAEIWLPTFLAIYAASALGIFIASITNKKRKALLVGIVVFLLQAMFTGAPFSVKRPLLSAISSASICRWSLESYAASANFTKIAADEAQKKARGAIEKGYEIIGPLDKKIGSKIEALKDSILNNEKAVSTADRVAESVAKKVLEDRGLSAGSPKQRIARAWAMLVLFAFCFSISAFGTLMAKKSEVAK